MKKPTLLLILSITGIASQANAVLDLKISPVEGNEFAFTFEATGTGSTTSADSSSGLIFIDDTPLHQYFGAADSGLLFGSEDVSGITRFGDSTLSITVDTTLLSGGTYGFTGGPVNVTLPFNYDLTFTPGAYNISNSVGIFGNNATGTLTIVPEPSTYAMILGMMMLGYAWIRRRS